MTSVDQSAKVRNENTTNLLIFKSVEAAYSYGIQYTIWFLLLIQILPSALLIPGSFSNETSGRGMTQLGKVLSKL